MIDPSGPLQIATFTALNGVISCPVYDRVPPNAAFPYVTIGDVDVMEDAADGYDGDYAMVNVHVWSRAGGTMEAKTIAGAVRAAMSVLLDASAHCVRVVTFLYERTRYLDDPDGVTKHAVVTLKYGVEPLV